MSAMSLRLLAPGPRRLALRLGLGLALPVALLARSVRADLPAPVHAFLLMLAAAQAAVAVTTSHKEILAASNSWFHFGLRRGLATAQLAWALLSATTAAGVMAFVAPAGGAAMAPAAAALAALGWAFGSRATLQFSWSYQLPLWLNYVAWLQSHVMDAALAGRTDVLMAAPAAWLAAAAAVLALLARDVAAPALHRSLCGTMVLGGDDLLRPGRIQEARRLSGSRSMTGGGSRWRARLVGAFIGAAGAARHGGKPVVARSLQAVALSAAVNISARGRMLALGVVALAVFAGFAGYYDSSHEGLPRWFGGLLYQAALVPLYGMPVVLLSLPGLEVARRRGFIAELAAVGWLALLATILSGLVLATLTVLAAVLPPLPWQGRELAFVAPRAHGLLLPLVTAPTAWLATAVRPRPQCGLGNFAVGLSFFGAHGLLTLAPGLESIGLLAAIAVVALAAAAALRRRWWLRSDMPA